MNSEERDILGTSMVYDSTEHKEFPLRKHQGIFARELSIFEASALIISGTIGAGILGLPYALREVGVWWGLLLIISMGGLMLLLNLLIAWLANVAGQPLQLVGLAKKYLGRGGELLMSAIMYSTLFGVLTVYIIGAGEALQALFGGDRILWSILFYAVATTVVVLGIKTLKKAELFLSLGILAVVIVLSFVSVPHISIPTLHTPSLVQFLAPYGILLFAFHGTTSIPEAHALLPKNRRHFRLAVLLAMIIITAVYSVFSFTVLSVTGPLTTPIATIGLGEKIGGIIFSLGNIFALLAMSTSFLMASLSLRDSLVWDKKISRVAALVIVSTVPFLLFVLGLRQFAETIDLIGGWLMSAETILILLMVLVAFRQKRKQTP